MSYTPGIDPIRFEIFKNALSSIVDEMALVIFRTAYSGVLKDVMDYSTAFCDRHGRMVAQGNTIPVHLGSVPDAMAAVRRRYGDDIHPGDIFCLNDPFEGGMHLPDIFAFQPIFHEGVLQAWAVATCHHTDVGGRVAGSNASDSTEIYQEGLRIPPLRLYERGVPNETLFRLLEKNVRLPVRLMGDLRAQLAACHIAEVSFLALVAKYGAGEVARYMDELIDYGERLTRAALAELPDGDYAFEDWIDDDGVDYGVPIPLRVKLTLRGDHLAADWTGSSPQVKGAINNTFSFTKAATYTCVRAILPAGIPNNEGFFRCIEVIAPPGTIAHAVLPAACAARGLTGFRMVDCCFGALAKMLPDVVYAASDGGNTGISVGGYDKERKPFIYVDFLASAWGGRSWTDGLDGNTNLMSNLASQPAEVCERETPLEILSCEFITDVGGPGKFRGGMSVRRDYRFLEDEGVLQVRADRFRFRPYGLYGGQEGRPGRNILNPGTPEERELPGKFTMTIRRGDVYRHEQAGAGGWGDPFERDPAAVLRDVRNGFVSPEAARRDYGVAIDTATWAVDEGETARLRGRFEG
ncbi:MAG: hydantoinase B/oxoprolinase family protein [Thermomicrobiales bacterium]